MSVLINLMCPCWVNNNFWMILCLPNYCIRAPLRHISPIILPDMVYQKLNYSLFIACFSSLGSCETSKMPALYALTQHQYSHEHTALTSQHSSESHFITIQMSCRRLCTSVTRALVSYSMTQSISSLAHLRLQPSQMYWGVSISPSQGFLW